jgi:hypothetical protein
LSPTSEKRRRSQSASWTATVCRQPVEHLDQDAIAATGKALIILVDGDKKPTGDKVALLSMNE